LAFFGKDVADSLSGDPQLLPDLLGRKVFTEIGHLAVFGKAVAQTRESSQATLQGILHHLVDDLFYPLVSETTKGGAGASFSPFRAWM
jgi:hypothetical protein